MRCRLVYSLIQTRKLLCNSLNTRGHSALTYSQLKQTKWFSTKRDEESPGGKSAEHVDQHNLTDMVDSKYKVFRDDDAQLILDDAEQQNYINIDDLKNVEPKVPDPFEGLNLKCGTTGVFDIDDLVAVLQRDNARNIFVASVPPEYAYVNYIVVVTGKSHKHMQAIATFVRKLYKVKSQLAHRPPKIEGEKSNDWIALDLGNIALHIFSDNSRNYYDLETLWSVGPEYDDESNKEFEDVTFVDQYNTILANMQPADVSEKIK